MLLGKFSEILVWIGTSLHVTSRHDAKEPKWGLFTVVNDFK